MTYRLFRLSRASIAAAAAVLLAAGCASSGKSGSGPVSGLEQTNLTVAAVPALDSAAVYIAQQRGFFAAEGLHVKIVSAISSATTIKGQLGGQYAVTSGAYVSYMLTDAQSNSDELQILAAGSIMEPRAQELVVPANSPIHSVADLRGKTIGVNVVNNIITMLVDSMLSDYGMSARDVHFVPIPFPNMAKALAQHKIDAASLPEPFVTSAEESIGAVPLVDLDQGATTGLPISGYIVTEKWLKANPNTAAAFRRAIIEAQRIADTDPVAVQKAMEVYAGVNREVAGLMATIDYPTDTDPILLQRVADLMQRFGLTKNAFQVNGMIVP
jgi:NitT/TauT family transport system substrate-binding protein